MFAPSMITKSPNNDNRKKYKNMWRKIHDLKHDIYKTKLRRFIQCLFFLIIIIIIYLFYKHIIPFQFPFNSSISPIIINNNISLINSSLINSSSIDLILADSKEKNNKNDKIYDINPKNLSQMNIIQFLAHYNDDDDDDDDNDNIKENNKSSSSSFLINEWKTKNLTNKPPLKLSSTQLDNISISNIVWDFGSCGCTGWGIETVNIIKPLSSRVDNIKLITDYDCWCPGFSKETQVIYIYIYIIYILFI